MKAKQFTRRRTTKELLSYIRELETRAVEYRKMEEQSVQMVAALQKSEVRYRTVVEDQTEFICRFRPEFILTFVNRSYCDYYGKTREELIGHSLFPLMEKQDRKIVRRQISSLTQEEDDNTYEQHIVSPDGEIRWQQWNNKALFSPSGTLIEIQSVGRDITCLKKAEASMKMMANKLQSQKSALQKKNIALREVLEQIDVEKREIKEKVAANIRESVLPLLYKLKIEVTPQGGKLLELLRSALEEISSSFGRKIARADFELTIREIEICSMIKSGISSKEIARLLYISFNTVENHRTNIRRKLGIANQRVNLAAFLTGL